MSQRFVILEHSVNGEAHFDLMLEVAGAEKLRTIQMRDWPLDVGGRCPAAELDSHRRIYLEFEGDIGGGRGVVKRIEEGSYTTTDEGVLLQSARGGEFELIVHDHAIERVR
jgi:hypothetical protein